jgi:hypothetical protein
MAVKPSELQYGLGTLGSVCFLPREKVELGHGARLVGLYVAQIETADKVVLAQQMLGDQIDLDE